jgi:uncharacterized protein (TIGR00369 family)
MSAPGFQPRDPRFEERVRQSFARQGAMALLGASLERVAPGRCEIHLPYRDAVSQQHGFFNGGIIATVADSAAGYAGFSLMPADTTVLTIEFKTNFLAPAQGGRETLVATMTATLMVVRHHDEKVA